MNNVFIALLLFTNFIMKGQNIRGKSFVAQTAVSCIEFSDGGGCSIYQYCYLQFEKEYVDVFFKSVWYCSTKEKESAYNNSNPEVHRYKWKKKRKTIIIKDFNDYGSLKIEEGKLVGTKERNYKEFVPIEFKEEPCQKK